MAKVALLIGVGQYRQPSEFKNLAATEADVAAMRQVLVQPEIGGFAEADVTTLLNPEPQQMREALDRLFANRRPDDLLVVYFSGHGVVDDRGKFHLTSACTEKGLLNSTAIPATYLHELMESSRSKRQVLILDCCFSGAFAKGMAAKGDAVNLQVQLGGRGRAVLTSSSATEYSFEHKESTLSVYTQYVVEGLRTGIADQNGDGMISVDELHEFAQAKVREVAPAMQPKIYAVEQGYKIVVAQAPMGDPKLEYRKEVEHLAKQRNGKLSPILQRGLTEKFRSRVSAAEAAVILSEVLQPYREFEEKMKVFEDAVAELLASPPDHQFLEDLQYLQQALGLRDEDISAIEAPVLAYKQIEAERQRVERLQQEQETKRLQQEQAKAIEAERQRVERLQQEQEAKRLLQEQAKAAERQRQEAKQQRQEQEKAEHENKLRRYEQEFAKAIQAEYPLNQFVLDGLKTFQQQLGLKDEDVIRVEQSIREPAESKYQEKLKQQAKAERQRQIELEQRRQIEEQRKQAETKYKAKAKGQPGTSQTASPQNNTGTRLRQFKFDVITVGKKGNENTRTEEIAEFFAEDLGNGVVLEMVKIPSGTFQMGSPEGQGNDNEKPQHAVTVPAFAMGKYPVTQAQWRAVADLPQVEIALNADPSNFKGDSRPVEQVSSDEAVEFCQRLSRVSGHLYHLPSEAEWEYACRAGTTTEFYFGETLTPKLARCKANLGMALITLFAGETVSVGSYLPNTFGLYDMHGNVCEWCADPWHGNYQDASTDGSVWTTNGDNEIRVIRGGSWSTFPVYCRSAYRLNLNPRASIIIVGFRVVCSSPRTFV